MSKLLEQAEAAILAIIDEHVAKATSEVQRKLEYAQQEFEVLKVQSTRELRSMQCDRDIIRGQWSAAVAERDDARQELSNIRQALRSETRAANAFMVERDQACAGRDALRGAVDRWHDSSIKARAELAGVAAQRDAHLSRSVELAGRVTELEAELKKVGAQLVADVTPAVDLVDGFRVGDLVRWKSLVLGDSHDKWWPIESIIEGYARYANARAHGIPLDVLARKPVEVGDTVRHINGSRIGVVVAASPHSFEVRMNALEQDWFASEACIAIAPTVKP